MDEKERAFVLSKNVLDKQHEEYVAYLEISVVSIATLLISVVVFLLSTGSAVHIFDASIGGAIVIIIVFKAIKDKLDDIKTRLKNLQ